jgi:hypothetical protein
MDYFFSPPPVTVKNTTFRKLVPSSAEGFRDAYSVGPCSKLGLMMIWGGLKTTLRTGSLSQTWTLRLRRFRNTASFHNIFIVFRGTYEMNSVQCLKYAMTTLTSPLKPWQWGSESDTLPNRWQRLWRYCSGVMTCNGEHVHRFTLPRDLVCLAAMQVSLHCCEGGGTQTSPTWREGIGNIRLIEERNSGACC